jgi:hypothetical protein
MIEKILCFFSTPNVPAFENSFSKSFWINASGSDKSLSTSSLSDLSPNFNSTFVFAASRGSTLQSSRPPISTTTKMMQYFQRSLIILSFQDWSQNGAALGSEVAGGAYIALFAMCADH